MNKVSNLHTIDNIKKSKSNKSICYFDNAATTKPYCEVIEIMDEYNQILWQNPSSLYDKAKRVNEAITSAKEHIGYVIGAKSNEIYFTSGGSESNCWAIEGFVRYWQKRGKRPVIIVSTIEHKSILECVKNLGVDYYFLDVDSIGKIQISQLERLFKQIKQDLLEETSILVSVQYANNEIGVIQPLKEIVETAHRYKAFVHSDMVQAIGNVPINVKEFDIDMASASGHKFHAVKGSGFLYIKKGVKIEPIIYGTQNNGFRGGTENVIGIVAMDQALQLCHFSDKVLNDKFIVRDKIIMKLKQLPYNIEFNNLLYRTDTLPTIISATIKERITAEGLIHILNTANVFISAGSACNSYSNQSSHVLKAIGLSEEDSIRTIRISFSDDTTDEDIDKLVSELDKAIKILIS